MKYWKGIPSEQTPLVGLSCDIKKGVSNKKEAEGGGAWRGSGLFIEQASPFTSVFIYFVLQ
jgi:hypothetical protein